MPSAVAPGPLFMVTVSPTLTFRRAAALRVRKIPLGVASSALQSTGLIGSSGQAERIPSSMNVTVIGWPRSCPCPEEAHSSPPTASVPAAYASSGTLPHPHARLASGRWLALAGRESNPLDSIEKFPSLHRTSSFPRFILALPQNSRN